MPRDMTIEELPTLDVTAYGDKDRVFIPAAGDGYSSKLSVSDLIESVKQSLGYLEKPLVKCKHCGQWGAAYCACRHCGAPIDPT